MTTEPILKVGHVLERRDRDLLIYEVFEAISRILDAVYCAAVVGGSLRSQFSRVSLIEKFLHPQTTENPIQNDLFYDYTSH